MTTEQFLQPAGKLTSADLVRFHFFHTWGRSWLLTGVVLIAWIFPIFGLVAVLSTGDPERLKNPGQFYFFGLLWPLLLTALPYWSARRQYAKHVYLREPMRYYFGHDRISLEGPSFNGEIEWKLVDRIYETRSLFLIYHSQVAWMLPKRFFWGDKTAIKQWKHFAITHLNKRDQFDDLGIVAGLT